jgi:glycosyltransferase involved in cell wall biosynthesis
MNTLETPQIEITVLMPCLNEAETIAACIEDALSAFAAANVVGEVLIADNGSSDGSQKIAEEMGARVLAIAERGYGSALIGGINAAKGKYILMGDADQSYDFKELPKFLEPLRNGAELVMGCRLPRGGGTIMPGAMPPLHRWLGNPVLSALGKIFFSSPADDFHCGLRAFNRESIVKLDLCTKGMEFASEMVVKATLSKLKIDQVPITLHPDGRTRAPHLRSWRDGWRHLRFMLLYSPDWLFILPGMLLFILGLIGFTILLPKPFTVGAITFDLSSLVVFSSATLIGVQILGFGILIKIYAINSGIWPGHERWMRFARGRSIDLGLLLGTLFLLFGLTVLFLAVADWRDAKFAALNYQESLRTTITAVTAIAFGLQTLFTSFAIAMVGMKK